ncbi:MAG: hypothetical protein IIC67_00225 [Thaumarchaeota archaeon]|nr:hypothetical protein [Nitrososphaerota archaeon]
MSEAFIVTARVEYSTKATGELTFIVLASNSRKAVKALLNSSDFPLVEVKNITISNYQGELVIDRN